MSRAQRRAMVERVKPVLPVSQQCRLLAVSRSAVYRKPAEVYAADLAMMALIDRQCLSRIEKSQFLTDRNVTRRWAGRTIRH